MKHSLLRLLALISLLTASSVLSFAQVSSTAPLSGTVTDPNGAVIAGATVSVKNPSTGQEFSAATGENGVFTIPAVSAGKYTVRVTANGFKTAVVKDVEVLAGTPANVTVAMVIGTTTEEIQISGGGEVLNTTSATVSSTIVGRQITDLPFASRNALDLVLFLPGTSSPARPRQSTINGLPKGSMNITVDGLNIQDNLLKSSDGFFTFIQPKTDAIDEVTVSTATPGAESAGEGAVQIKFVTRAGSNSFNGSAYEYLRNPVLNANYYFNNLTGQPRSRVILNQPGFRLGGPIIKDRIFFFVNYEEYRLPEATFRQRQILNPNAQAGFYTYTDGSGVSHSINVLGLAAAANSCGPGVICPSAIDPTVGSLLTSIRQSTTKGGTVAALDGNMDQLSFINTGGQTRRFPTVRFDINLTSKHHLENVYNYQQFRNRVDFLNNADPAFPGFTNSGGQDSDRFSDSIALRSTLSNTLVNEARFGFVGGSSRFQRGANLSQFDVQGGFALGLNAFGNGIQTLSNATSARTPNKRNSPLWQFNDNLNWNRGDHNLAFGMSFTQVNGFIDAFGGVAGLVPTINLGLLTGDPAANLFSATNFPGSSATQRGQAQALYAVLTGHVTAINGSASIDENTGKYASQGHLVERFHQREFGFYGQDTWRFRPNLTLTGGLRWEVQMPFTPLNDVYTITTQAGLFGVSGEGNLFKPGTLTGQPTTFNQFKAGDKAYNTDHGDFAPSIGFAWSPNFKEGWLRKLGGENGQTVVRGGYSISYTREGTNFFSAAFDGNGGVIFNTTRNATLGNINPGTLLSNGVSLVTPPTAPTFPYVAQAADQGIAFAPDLKTGRVHSWTFGIQRELNKDTVIEARYVGNRAMDLWRLFSLNETNLVENGFLNEFKLAQQNLIANNAAGGTRAGSFAYFGAGTNTSPLPIIVGYFNGVSTANANNKDLYTSANFKSATFINTLGTALPNAGTFATNLWGNAGLRSNALAAGLAANLFVVNPGMGSPTAGGPFLINNDTRSYYDAFVFEVRRRLSHGLLFQGSYTFSKSLTNSFASSSFGQKNYFSLHDKDLDRGVSPFDVNHAFKANFIYELPVGKGQRFLDGQNSLVDHLVSGWSVNGTARIQSGTPFGLGNVQLVGMSRQELQDSIAIRHGANSAGAPVVFYLPPDIIANTIAAFNGTFAPTGRYLAPPNMNAPLAFGGAVGNANLVLYGPRFTRFDIGIVKRTKITERVSFEFRTELLNAFNNIDFRVTSPNNDVGTIAGFGSSTFGQTTFAYQDTSTTNDPGGRLIQFVARINF